MRQFGKVLPNDLGARKAFVQSGSLQRIQQIQAESGSKLAQFVADVNALYPPEVVSYYSPQYPELLLKKVDEFRASARINN